MSLQEEHEGRAPSPKLIVQDFFWGEHRSPWIALMTGMIVALSSQLYMNLFVDGFRISLAVVLLPILLSTIGRNVPIWFTTLVTVVCVFLVRGLGLALVGSTVEETIHQLLPNLFFYLMYGLFFWWVFPDRRKMDYRMMFPSFVVVDFLANTMELCVTESQANNEITVRMVATLFMVALMRGALAWLVMLSVRQYEDILALRERESRYQSLFMMNTALKNEIYFMRKNSEEIESVMGQAYRLYESLDRMEVPEETRQMSLSIAKDVHEIKKDYLRIIQGIEMDIADDQGIQDISFREMMHILRVSSEQLMADQTAEIIFDFQVEDDFVTEQHYELMAVLKNIVGNAMEAIIGDWEKRKHRVGRIALTEALEGDSYRICVEDNGPGISPRHLPHIFRMGYSTKFDPATGNIYRGVGLYGAKTTVEETFGGSIEVSSEKGSGTRFTIRIPAEAFEKKE